MKYIVDIHGEIEGDYEIIGKYEERPQGEWICKYKDDGHLFGYSCSNCRLIEWRVTRFCPNCGARMGAENDQ